MPALPDPPVKPKGRPGAQVREGRCVSALVSEGLSFARLYCFFHFCTAFFFNSVLILMWGALMESRLAPKVEGRWVSIVGTGRLCWEQPGCRTLWHFTAPLPFLEPFTKFREWERN